MRCVRIIMTIAVKICGIKTPEMAGFCARAGAQFIGIVLHPESPRYVDFDTAVLIAKAANEAKIIPVAVVVNTSNDELLNLCEKAKINHVQLHGADQTLPENIHKIYVAHQQIPKLRLKNDYLLFDGPEPGAGQAIDWSKLKIPDDIRFFLAGGLTVQNVKEAINIVHPFGVDVSSGVESSRGVKSESLIQEFINQVQNA